MHIHIADFTDDNVRMILPPSADGEVPIVYTYTVSGVDDATGMTFDGTHIHIADITDDNVRMILPPSANGQADIVYTYTVDGVDDATGMTFDGTHIHIADRTDDNVRMILPPSANSNNITPVYTYTVSGVGNATGMTFDGTHIHIADQTDDNVRMILPPSADGEVPIVYTYTVSGVGNATGMTFDGTHIHIADITDDNVRMILPPSANGQADIVYTYTVDGVNAPHSMAFDGVSQATLTITTDDSDIRVGETVDFDIASDIDISDFAASDITVTGGTRGTLTETDAQNFVLSVVVGSTASLTIAIAENAVTPGNAAVSQSFTVKARIAGTIAFSETALETDGTATVTVTLNGAPDSNLASSSLTTDTGTLSSFSGSGTSYTATLTAPSTGSGTITVTLAADAITAGGLGNLEATATIDYAATAEALVATTLSIVSGNNQSAEVSTELTNPLVVQVDDQNDDALSGVTVTFSTTGGTLSETSVTTDSNGQAETELTLPDTEGDYTVTASVTGLTDVEFNATATMAQTPVTPVGLEARGIQILFAEYITPLPHATALDGSLVVRERSTSTVRDLNDVRFLIVSDENVTGLQEADITLSTDSRIMSFRGENACYEIVIRPPDAPESGGYTGEISITIAANAATEGNPETTATFPYSDAIPEAAWQHEFSTTDTYNDIVSITDSDILLLRGNTLDFFDHDGSLQSDKQIVFTGANINIAKRYAPSKYLCLDTSQSIGYLLDVDNGVDWESAQAFTIPNDDDTVQALAINSWAISGDQRLFASSMLFMSNPISFGVMDIAEVHRGIQDGL